MAADSTNTELIHNLRNQLNNIVMNAELAKLELAMQDTTTSADPGGSPALEPIEAILTACAESANIVNALSTQSVEDPEPPTTGSHDGK